MITMNMCLLVRVLGWVDSEVNLHPYEYVQIVDQELCYTTYLITE